MRKKFSLSEIQTWDLLIPSLALYQLSQGDIVVKVLENYLLLSISKITPQTLDQYWSTLVPSVILIQPSLPWRRGPLPIVTRAGWLQALSLSFRSLNHAFWCPSTKNIELLYQTLSKSETSNLPHCFKTYISIDRQF